MWLNLIRGAITAANEFACWHAARNTLKRVSTSPLSAIDSFDGPAVEGCVLIDVFA
jgi:hypothetical protein